MNRVIDLIEKYRRETSLTKRLDLATEIFCEVLDGLRLVIFSKVPKSAVEDVLQETLKSIFLGLDKFKGTTDKEFLGWCYQIARNKVSDYHRKEYSSRLEPFPADELLKLAEESATYDPRWKYEKRDVRDALDLLEKTKPGCRALLWNHFVIGLDYAEIAEELQLKYNAARMKIARCLKAAGTLLTT
jgi:RNA polymerase sigma factor (sigma-70 family)